MLKDSSEEKLNLTLEQGLFWIFLLGAFRDIDPRDWWLLSGYVMLQSDLTGSMWIISHQRHVGALLNAE